MATESSVPPNPTDQKPQNPASEVVQPTLENQQDMAEASKESSPPSVFVNSEPMREDQVQNAVKFLSHPRVRGSPVIYRRSFLERKGLTKEEIDEAFRRVPDPTPTISNAPTTVTNQDSHAKSSANINPQAPSQSLQPAVVTPAGVISKVGTFSRFHWSHALLAVGVLAASGAGTAVLFKKTIIPTLKSWIRKVVMEEEEDPVAKSNSKPSLTEEAAAAAKAAAAAAAEVAQASQEMLVSKTEENRYFKELMDLLGVQVREMKSMSKAIQKLEGRREAIVDYTLENLFPLLLSAKCTLSLYISFLPTVDNPERTEVQFFSIGSCKSIIVEVVTPEWVDYFEHLTERNIVGLKGSATTFSRQSNTPRRISIAEQDDHRVSVSRQSYANGNADFDLRSGRSSSPPATVESSVAPHPKSYAESVAMVQRGERPPNIRKINDLPSNPNQPVSIPHITPRPQPWEFGLAQNTSNHVLHSQESSDGLDSIFQDNGLGNQLNGDSSVPWWQRKNVRITEIESEDEHKTGSSSVLTNGRPVQRSWVPPQPPPVVMPEAAAAIRQPKKSLIQKEELTDDQLLARSSDITDELQRITKISESGGVEETNGGISELNRNEIQNEDNSYIET
ncbi:unnamed protein product [Ilex paraguariensis]|uniref:Peroxisomal membrane protein PEX14 n=1 Tax=Ilex paraguariensis TaxID=185542 RepID=A0ABC8R0T7_9AQUA